MERVRKKDSDEGGNGIPVVGNDGYVLPSWNKVNGGRLQRVAHAALPIAHLLGILAVGSVLVWCTGFRGGFVWNSPNKDLLFNFHPALMVGGLVFLHGEANLVYRTVTGSKKEKKLLHLLAQGIALLLGVAGILAAIKFHNDKGIDNFYSLHSWLGLITIALFSTQWSIGLWTFWYPGAAAATRAAFLPWHVFLGLLTFALSLVTAETGLLEKLTFMQAAGVTQRFGSEAALVNSIGIILLLFGCFVSMSLVMKR